MLESMLPGDREKWKGALNELGIRILYILMQLSIIVYDPLPMNTIHGA